MNEILNSELSRFRANIEKKTLRTPASENRQVVSLTKLISMQEFPRITILQCLSEITRSEIEIQAQCIIFKTSQKSNPAMLKPYSQ
jgi:hypothetical protein